MVSRNRDGRGETLAVFRSTDVRSEPLTTGEVADALECSRQAATDRLEGLVEEGVLAGKRVGGAERVWWKPDGEASTDADGEGEIADGLFRSLVEATEEYAIFMLDPDGHVISWNAGAERIKGYEESEIVGEHFSTFYTEEEAAAGVPKENLSRALEEGSAEDEGWRVRADGSRFWANITITPIRDDDGELRGFAKVTRDMTDRREYERQLEEKNERLETRRDELESELDDVFERVSNAVFGLDDEWRFTYVNDRAADVLGRPEAELLGASIWDALAETAESTFEAKFREAVETQEPVHFEEYYQPLETWFEVDAYPSESGLSVYLTDVTERKERERELERYERIVENVPVGVYRNTPGPDGEFVAGNAQLAAMFDADSVDELVGSPVSDLYPDPERRAEFSRHLEEAGVVEDYELKQETLAGREIWISVTAMRTEEGGDVYFDGVVQDVTERKERERELEARARQQEVVADLGQRALGMDDLDGLFAEAVDLVTDTLDSDYCKVFDLDREAEDLVVRASAAMAPERVGSAAVDVGRQSQAGYTLLADEPIVVEDMAAEDRFEGPDGLVEADVRSGISAVVGSRASPWGVLATHDTDRREFSEDDALFVQSVANILAAAVDRRDNERELENQREHLAALDNLNGVVRDINEALVEQSTREEIEQTVCDRLADSDSYRFAWTAAVDPRTDDLEPRVEAGVEGYVADAGISVDPDRPEGQGPAGRAARSKEIQVTHDALSDPTFEPWRDLAEAYGYRSCAAIPIVHQDTLYGILAVYTDRVGAFADEKEEVIAQLGEIIGHAIASIERKQALMSDDVVEIDVRVDDVFAAADGSESVAGTVAVTETVSVGDDTFLQYGTAEGGALASMESLVEELSHWEALTVLGDDPDEGDETRFELKLSEPPVVSAVADSGGYVEAARIEGDTMHVRIHLPPTIDVRRMVDGIRDTYADAKLVTRQQVSRTESEQGIERTLTEELTERQRAALEASFHAGFFDWPRESSGEEVAESLDVSAPTFHQHLRKAQRKLLESVLA